MRSYRDLSARAAAVVVNERRVVMAMLMTALILAVSGTFVHAAPNQFAINVDANAVATQRAVLMEKQRPMKARLEELEKLIKEKRRDEK